MDEEVIPLERCAPPGSQSQVTPARTKQQGGMLSLSLGWRREVPKLPPQGVRSEPLDTTISRQIDMSWDVLDAASDERMHCVPHNLWRQSPPPG